MESWSDCNHVLVIRADHMGDLLMSSPAIRNLKRHLHCKITLLTSTKAAPVAALLPQIDEVMVYDVPWMNAAGLQHQVDFHTLIELVKDRDFDACVVFTVYSQNPMPAMMLAFLAHIPLRLAYCRENPYHMLSHWVPDQEPYRLIKHQVKRDLDLVAAIGVTVNDQALTLQLPLESFGHVIQKLKTEGLSLTGNGYYVFNPGVSEQKRRFPKARWISLAKALIAHDAMPVLISGTVEDQTLAIEIARETGVGCYAIAGLFPLAEFAALLADARAVVSVNTGTVHLAAAVQTPIVVLHAQTNPQHSPWGVSHKVLPFGVPEQLKSRNEVLRWVDQQLYSTNVPLPETDEILDALIAIT